MRPRRTAWCTALVALTLAAPTAGCGDESPAPAVGSISSKLPARWTPTLLSGRVVYVDSTGMWIRGRGPNALEVNLATWSPNAVFAGHAVLPAAPGDAEIITVVNGDTCIVSGRTDNNDIKWSTPFEGVCSAPAGRGRLVVVGFGETATQVAFIDGDTGAVLAQIAVGSDSATMGAYVPGGIGEVSTGGSHWRELWAFGVGQQVKLVGYDGASAKIMAETDLGRTVTSVLVPSALTLAATTRAVGADVQTAGLGDQIVRLKVTEGAEAGTLETLGSPLVAPSAIIAHPVANAERIIAGGNRWLSVWDATSGLPTATFDESDFTEVITGLALGADDWVYTGGSHWLVGDTLGHVVRRVEPLAGAVPQPLVSNSVDKTLAIGSPLLGCDGSITLAVFDKDGRASLAEGAAVGVFGHDTGWSRGPGGEHGGGTGRANESCEPHKPRRVAVGVSHSCAIFDGKVGCWGSNTHGEIGFGAPSPQVETPALVDGLAGETMIGVAAGGHFSCALAASGTVYCWGRGTEGQLGTGTTVDSGAAVAVVGIDDAVAVAVTRSSSSGRGCVILKDASHWCWGQLSFPDNVMATTPIATGVGGLVAMEVSAPDCWIGQVGWTDCHGPPTSLSSPWHSVSARLRTSGCAVTPTALWCEPSYALDETAPMTPTDIQVNATKFCAVQDDAVICATAEPSADKGVQSFSFSPVADTDGADQVAVGTAHACAAMLDGSVSCWGEVGQGWLGNGSTSRIFGATPVPTVTASHVGLGGSFACAGTPGDQAHCWGDNALGQLGSAGAGPGPTLVDGLVPTGPLATGKNHWCVVIGDGTEVACFGNNSSLELGTPDTAATSAIVTLGAPVVLLATGVGTTCVLTDQVLCWGTISGKNVTSAVPTPVLGAPSVVDDLALILNSLCARSGSEIHCGALGESLTLEAFTAGVVTIAAAESRLCALLDDGSMECIATAGGIPSSYVSPPESVAVAAGSDHICVLSGGGEVSCLGDNLYGQLGQGGGGVLASDLAWLQVPGLSGVVAVDAMNQTTCAILADSTVECWGDNNEGQAGQSGFESVPAAQKVSAP